MLKYIYENKSSKQGIPPLISWADLKKAKYEQNNLKQKKDRDVGGLKGLYFKARLLCTLFIWGKGNISQTDRALPGLEMLEYGVIPSPTCLMYLFAQN